MSQERGKARVIDDGTKKLKAAPPKSTLKLSTLTSERKPTKPLSATAPRAVARPPPAPTAGASSSKSQLPAFDSNARPRDSQPSKGKQKARQPEPMEEDAAMWVDLYEPKSEEDLVVHKKKVEQVRMWLTEATSAGVIRKYRRILALTGPSGAGKTATLRVLAREFDLEIVEWRNTLEDVVGEDDPLDRETLSQKFTNFLSRASSYSTIPGSSSSSAARRVVLLEDLPNILHPLVLQQFHSALISFVEQSHENSCPLVIIVSDAGVRGEYRDEMGTFSGDTNTFSIRTVLPHQLLSSPYVQLLSFNPVAPTRMRKSLQTLLAKEEPKRKADAELLDAVVQGSSGDIRAAIMALQFACIVDGGQRSGKKSGKGKKDILEAVTKRETTLALFHLLGKILYNKRKGDPPNSSASAKDIERDRDADKNLPDPPKLPQHLREEHDRPTSRVNIHALYSDAPIDTSLLSLYLYQNYPQYTSDVWHCSEVAECFSIFDCTVRTDEYQHWSRTMPHQFYAMTLGMLHSLPTPVPRTGQKMYKPDLFEVFQKAKDAESAVRDVRAWLGAELSSEGPPPTIWTASQAVLELGPVLAARELSLDQPPSSHERFSRLKFTRDNVHGRRQALDEDYAVDEEQEADTSLAMVHRTSSRSIVEKEKEHGWLESDLIEDF